MSHSGQRRCGSPAAISSRNIRLQTPQSKGTKLKTISAPNAATKTGKVIRIIKPCHAQARRDYRFGMPSP
jgi:hypothetical protein